jgi:hypothetical protein
MSITGPADGMSEKIISANDLLLTRKTLDKFERSKILEVYFARLDGRIPDSIPSDHHELYQLELKAIKAFLMGQYPQDTLLQKIFGMLT